MNASDLLIIYLACGAPFAVYFYLQNRRRLYLRQLTFKTVLNFIFWVPFSIQFLFHKIFSIKISNVETISSELLDENLEVVQKKLERIAAQTHQINFYEFRETLNRYTGLSLAILNENLSTIDSEREIFRFSEFENNEIGSICLHRRNRQRLLFHQRLAGTDFTKAVFGLAKECREPEQLEQLSTELTEVLHDFQTNESLRNFFINRLQIEALSNVRNAEKLIWNSPQPKLPNLEQVSINMTTLNRTNSPLKD